MKIISLSAENIKKLKVVDITPAGNFVQISGKNGSGKSSVLDAIFYALAGTSAIPDQPIRQGEEKAHIRLDLGDYIVTRRFSKGGTSLVVENKDGARYGSPQELLNSMIGKLSFDPLEFSRMEPQKQFDALKKIAEVDVDFDAVKKANDADTIKRRDIGRDITALEGQVKGIVVPENAPDVGVSVKALMEEMNRMEESNAMIHEEEIEQENANTRLGHIAKRVGELNNELIELAEEERRLQGFLKNAPTITYRSTDEVKKKIADAEQINAAYQAKIRKGELNGQIALKQKSYADITAAMDARAKEVEKAVTESKMPIDGLTLVDGGVLYNGVPFSQLSSAEQIRVSTAIAMAANPKLRIIRIKDGSLLDDESMAILQAMTAEKDYQAWIERVDTTGKIGIVMEDGAIKANNEEAA